MPGRPQNPRSLSPKELALELRKRLHEAYQRGATSEVTNWLLEEFGRLRTAYDERLKALRKQAGL